VGVSVLDVLNASIDSTTSNGYFGASGGTTNHMNSSGYLLQTVDSDTNEEESYDLADSYTSLNDPYSTIGDGTRPRIGKVSMLFGRGDLYKKNADLTSLYERSLATHTEHAKLHGYPFFVARQEILPTAWTKHAYILSVILQEMAKPEEERLEWLMWVDADTIVMNPKTPLEAFLPPPDLDKINMVIAQDSNGLNDGVFFVRICQWSVRLFSNIIALKELRKEVRLKYIEQGAVMWMLDNKQLPQYNKSVALVPQSLFNAYEPEWFSAYRQRGRPFTAGDHLLHLVGPSSKNHMGKWLDEAEAHKEEWELDLSMTSTPEDIRKVWNTIKSHQMRFV